MDTTHSHQQKVKQAFDRKVRKKEFEIGDLVLKWMLPDRIRENRKILTPYGSGHSKYLRFSQITCTGCRIWRGRRFLTAQ